MTDQHKIIDFLKAYLPSDPTSYKIATSLLNALSEESLKKLLGVAESDFIRYRIRTMLKAAARPKKNTPVKTLLELYTDKRSGKVMSSRDELFRRFPYLDPRQQVQVADAFFAGSDSDSDKMAGYLLRNWADHFTDLVARRWQLCPFDRDDFACENRLG